MLFVWQGCLLSECDKELAIICGLYKSCTRLSCVAESFDVMNSFKIFSCIFYYFYIKSSLFS